MKKQNIYKICIGIFILVSIGSLALSLYSYLQYNPNIANDTPNSEKLLGAVLVSTIPGLPLSWLLSEYLRFDLTTPNAFLKVLILNLLNIFLGYITWFIVPQIIFNKFITRND